MFAQRIENLLRLWCNNLWHIVRRKEASMFEQLHGIVCMKYIIMCSRPLDKHGSKFPSTLHQSANQPANKPSHRATTPNNSRQLFMQIVDQNCGHVTRSIRHTRPVGVSVGYSITYSKFNSVVRIRNAQRGVARQRTALIVCQTIVTRRFVCMCESVVGRTPPTRTLPISAKRDGTTIVSRAHSNTLYELLRSLLFAKALKCHRTTYTIANTHNDWPRCPRRTFSSTLTNASTQRPSWGALIVSVPELFRRIWCAIECACSSSTAYRRQRFDDAIKWNGWTNWKRVSVR